MKIQDYLDNKRKIIDKVLLKYLPRPKGPSGELAEAMRYSVLAGGKRIRPVIILAISDMLGMSYNKVLPTACAVEYIHTSTLILDDLPCMDNSYLRRGAASVHKKFGESTAILASYSLVVLAFELLVENATKVLNDPKLISVVTKEVSKGVGYDGVCAGQYLDLKAGSRKIDIGALTCLHEHKTADLFVVCCKIAGRLSGADQRQLKALQNYGRYLGLAFQAYDDMLSIRHNDRQLGKETNRDKHSPNIVNLFGIKRTGRLLDVYAKTAQSNLATFGPKAKILEGILEYVIRREK